MNTPNGKKNSNGQNSFLNCLQPCILLRRCWCFSTVKLALQIENLSAAAQQIKIVTDVYSLQDRTGKKTASFSGYTSTLQAGEKWKAVQTVAIKNPLKIL